MTDLRDGVAEDLEPVLALDTALFGASAWTRAAMSAEFERLRESRAVVVAVCGETLQGYGLLLLLRPVADLLRIGVAVECHRQGLGSALLDALLDRAKAAGCAEILLEVDAGNDPARSLYRRHGFEEISRRLGYYADGGDAVIMRRGLSRRTGG